MNLITTYINQSSDSLNDEVWESIRQIKRTLNSNKISIKSNRSNEQDGSEKKEEAV